MKAALYVIGRFWLDFILWLLALTVASFIFNAIRSDVSILTLPASAASVALYAFAATLLFSFPRATRLLSNRPLGYLILFLASSVVMSGFAFLLPFLPPTVTSPVNVRQLPTDAVVPLIDGDIFIGSARDGTAKNVILFRPGAAPSAISRHASVPLSADGRSVIIDGVSYTPYLPPPEPQPPVLHALDYEGTRARLLELAGSGLAERLAFALAVTLAFVFLWPLSRTGAWPIVSFCASFAAAAGVFALLALLSSDSPGALLAYADLKLAPSWILLGGCGAFSFILALFDLIFLRSPKGGR